MLNLSNLPKSLTVIEYIGIVKIRMSVEPLATVEYIGSIVYFKVSVTDSHSVQWYRQDKNVRRSFGDCRIYR